MDLNCYFKPHPRNREKSALLAWKISGGKGLKWGGVRFAGDRFWRLLFWCGFHILSRLCLNYNSMWHDLHMHLRSCNFFPVRCWFGGIRSQEAEAGGGSLSHRTVLEKTWGTLRSTSFDSFGPKTYHQSEDEQYDYDMKFLRHCSESIASRIVSSPTIRFPIKVNQCADWKHLLMNVVKYCFISYSMFIQYITVNEFACWKYVFIKVVKDCCTLLTPTL